MRRRYTAGQFRKTLDAVKARLDRPAITTDVMVGFPSETNADFEATVKLAKEACFAKMHVFSFSPRNGTPAARFARTVDKKVMKERSRILCDLSTELGMRFREQFIGEKAQILLEKGGDRPSGRSERYFMVHVEKSAQNLRKNEIICAILKRNEKNGMIAEPFFVEK
jgi:threonylcarbamoyladenosine tRNA methylthiotransferase MtaB